MPKYTLIELHSTGKFSTMETVSSHAYSSKVHRGKHCGRDSWFCYVLSHTEEAAKLEARRRLLDRARNDTKGQAQYFQGLLERLDYVRESLK